jgi:hypothetical protein
VSGGARRAGRHERKRPGKPAVRQWLLTYVHVAQAPELQGRGTGQTRAREVSERCTFCRLVCTPSPAAAALTSRACLPLGPITGWPLSNLGAPSTMSCHSLRPSSMDGSSTHRLQKEPDGVCGMGEESVTVRVRRKPTASRLRHGGGLHENAVKCLPCPRCSPSAGDPGPVLQAARLGERARECNVLGPKQVVQVLCVRGRAGGWEQVVRGS